MTVLLIDANNMKMFDALIQFKNSTFDNKGNTFYYHELLMVLI